MIWEIRLGHFKTYYRHEERKFNIRDISTIIALVLLSLDQIRATNTCPVERLQVWMITTYQSRVFWLESKKVPVVITYHWWREGNRLHSAVGAIVFYWSFPLSLSSSGNRTQVHGSGMCCKHYILPCDGADFYSAGVGKEHKEILRRARASKFSIDSFVLWRLLKERKNVWLRWHIAVWVPKQCYFLHNAFSSCVTFYVHQWQEAGRASLFHFDSRMHQGLPITQLKDKLAWSNNHSLQRTNPTWLVCKILSHRKYPVLIYKPITHK